MLPTYLPLDYNAFQEIYVEITGGFWTLILIYVHRFTYLDMLKHG